MRAPGFWDRRNLASTLLLPAGVLHTAAGRLRRWTTRARQVSVPVVCIGNLVVGGAGKTPVAIAIARRYLEMGIDVQFLSRGYGGRLKGPLRVDTGRHGAGDVGDEPLLLAEVAPCWIARDRSAGAFAAVAGGAEVIVMDDGHQNPSLEKTVSMVVIDGQTGFGNGRVMPAGPLREPVADGLARADAVVVIGDDHARVAMQVPPGRPVLAAILEPAGDAEAITGATVYGFAGIARPAKFRQTLEGLGCTVALWRDFPDHHPYRRAEIQTILRDAEAAGAVPVTTEKDAVRLPKDLKRAIRTVRVVVTWRNPAQLQSVLPAARVHG